MYLYYLLHTHVLNAVEAAKTALFCPALILQISSYTNTLTKEINNCTYKNIHEF